MSTIRILAIPPDNHGVGKFRIITPFVHLQDNYANDFHIDIKPQVPNEDKEFENYDIIVMHTFIHADQNPEINISRMMRLREQGKIVIMDLDDYWEPDTNHPMYIQIKAQGIDKKKVEMMKNATYISVTTPLFRDTIRKKLGLKNVQVFANAIDEKEIQFQPNPTKSERIRFGWLGGSSHLNDIQLLKGGIDNMYNNYLDRVQFVLCGYDLRGMITEINQQTGEKRSRPIMPKETVWYKYEQIFTSNYLVLDKPYSSFLQTFKEIDYDDLNKPYRRRWTQDISKYAMNYNHFDVSLAPLYGSFFNGNKSQLKAIEAGFHKKALIASDVNPYTIDLINAMDKGGTFNSKGNALLVDPTKNHKQWFQYMKKLVENPTMIEDLGNRLYETVKDKYSLKTVSKQRSEFFKSIIK